MRSLEIVVAPLSLGEVAATGDRRATLESLRDRLARAIETCDSMRDVSSLSNQLRATLTELDAIPTQAADDPVNEIAARAARKRAAATS
jgi:hypothetical protein